MDYFFYYKIKDYRFIICSLLVKYYFFVRNDEVKNIVVFLSWFYWINYYKFVYFYCINIYWFLIYKFGFVGIYYIVIYCKFLIKGWGNICVILWVIRLVFMVLNFYNLIENSGIIERSIGMK